MELIQKWLSGKRNFIIGAVLYKKFGTDEKLKKLFEGKPDAYMQKRLADELSALLKKPKVVLQSKPKKSEAEEMPASNDPVLKALRNEWMGYYQRMNYLRHELDKHQWNSSQEIAIREPMAFEILSLEQKCMAIWARRDYYLKEGKLPEVKEKEDPLPENPVELGKKIETVKRNIRRNKELTEKHPDKSQYPQRVIQYEKELERIMQTINNGKTEG